MTLLKRGRARTLGQRIGGRYALFLARTGALLLAVFTFMFWLVVIAHASSICDRAFREVSIGQWQTGVYVVGETGLARDARGGWTPGFLPQNVEGQLYLVRGSGEYTVIFALSGYAALFVALFLTLAAVEALRIALLVHHADGISRKALRPISDIVEAARAMTPGNLSGRIHSDEATGELDELITVLNSMLGRIESAYNNQKQFVSDASHELRTPIAVIQGYADMLARWGKDDESVRDEAIEAISSETRAMNELVEKLLFIARHENSPQRYEMAYLDLSELAQETVRDMQLVGGERVIEAGEMQSCIVCGDKNALKQALRVFVDNAIKYTKLGGHITVSCVRENGWARLCVADDGIGIDEEDLPHVFDRFYRAASVRGSDVDGHGLGLAIARLIAQAHGGKLEVASKKGAGSKFSILLRL